MSITNTLGSASTPKTAAQHADMEPQIEQMLREARTLREQPPYKVRTLPEVQAALENFFANTEQKGAQINQLRRMGGGASKEQFVFELRDDKGQTQNLVLRMDPLESAVVTNRAREFAILEAIQGIIPGPKPLWVDNDGSLLGRPALITDFVSGVTKPSNTTSNVSGFGTGFTPAMREALSKPFMRHLVDLHAIDWQSLNADCFQAPNSDPQQAARWALNWWTTVWRDDVSEGYPLMGLAERWMRDNLPACSAQNLVLVHSDYRTGNYLFNEQSCEITAVLDWELIHIGDFHEDLAWAAIKSWSTVESGTLYASGLMTLEQLCAEYSKASGRSIDMKTLYFYQVLGLYKCVAICLATSVNAARHSHNHQDALLSWLAAAGHTFLKDLHELLEQGAAE